MARRLWIVAFGVLVAAACGGGESAPDPDGGVGPDGAAVIDSPAPPDASAPACQGLPAQPVDAIWTVNGRDMRVHVPASYDPATPAPLVLVFHGLGMDAQQMEAVSGLSAK